MDIYREEILEHWQNPQNFGVMDGADVVVEENNPVCGDQITMYVRFNAEKRPLRKRSEASGRKNAELIGKMKKTSGAKVAHVSFVGSGCAISVASASILSENIKGKSVEEISKLQGKDVLKLIGADSSFPPARLKCAFLALEAVRKITTDN